MGDRGHPLAAHGHPPTIAFAWQHGDDTPKDGGKSRASIVRAGDYAGSIGVRRVDAVMAGERVGDALTRHHGRNSGEDTFVAATLGAAFGRNRGLGQENEIDTLVCGAQGAAHGGPDDTDAQANRLVVGTLNAHSKEHGHGMTTQQAVSAGHVIATVGVRRLTPRECERLQGFPDDWTAWGVDEQGQRVEMSDSARYRMLGNAVNRKVSAWIDRRIVEVLG